MEKTHCRVCNSPLKEIFSLGDQYLSHFKSSKEDKPPKSPLVLMFCSKCKLVQLKHTVDPVQLYGEDYGYKSGINDTMKKELAEIVWQAQKIVPVTDNDIVVDIGANDGTLLDNFPEKVVKIGYEPVKKLAADAVFRRNASPYFTYFIDFFSADPFIQKFEGKKAKIVTAISMFYDFDDPNLFLEDILKILAENGILVIQQNYLLEMLNQNAFDNIVHEHLEYYSLTSLEYLLEKHGLEVFKVEQSDINGGSIRTFIARKGMFNPDMGVYELRKREKGMNWEEYLKNFGNSMSNICEKIHNFIKEEQEKGKKIYIYGASTRGNTLIQACRLTSDLIEVAVERNPDKFGKYISSIGVPIISEEAARKQKPDYFLVLPWFFKSEIIEREKEFRENGGRLIFPLPDFEIVGEK